MPKHSDGSSAPAHVEFPVVGLGASAGGVTALQQFFEALPATTGAAYVVVLHLPPGHPSSLDSVLQKAIALSGFGRDSDVQEALRAGFDAHLTKPVTLDALLNTMARLRAR